MAIAYNVLLRPGVTLGVGASFDTQKLDQATHKVRIPCMEQENRPRLSY